MMSSEKILLDNKQSVYREYDPNFTADISKKMQLPERLIAVNGYFDDSSLPFKTHYTSIGSGRLDSPLSHSLYDEHHYVLATPPSSITHFSGITLAEEDGSDNEIEKLKQSLARVTDQKTFRGKRPLISSSGKDGMRQDNDEEEDESSIPMTPGTMLLMQNGDSIAALQRQIGKLNHRVVKLQEENRRRKNRELVFYPLIIGYLVFQFGRFVFKHQ